MIEVYLLVATIVFRGAPPTHAVPADQPFFRTLAECQQRVAQAQNAPPIVETLLCERAMLDPKTGRTTRTRT